MYYNTNGISSELPKLDKFWFQKSFDRYIYKEGDISVELDFICIALQHLLAEKIFGSRQAYFSLLITTHTGITYGRIDSDVKISKEEFEKMVQAGDTNEVFNKLLYYYDCRNLISTLQNSILETQNLVGQFYELLNENNFLLNTKPINSTGLQFAGGFTIINIVSVMNYLFVNLHSQLDFITKIIYEFENLEKHFSKYPKIKSAKILYGNSKHLKIKKQGTLLENSKLTNLIMTLRNEIVHNASLDNLPKVYQLFKDGILIEKYILLPDTLEGKLKTYQNRRRFFDNENKLNEILPALVIEFWQRLKQTLQNIK